jgi:hypothetical protein
MERGESRLTQSASVLVLFPILGMLGGIILGVIRVWILRGDEIAAVVHIVRGGFIGSVIGVVAAVLVAVLERRAFTSVRKLMVLVLVVGVVFWAVITLIRDLVANGTL